MIRRVGTRADVDHVGEVERGRRAGLAGLLDELLHQRLGDLPEVQRGQVGPAQVQDARREGEEAAVGADVAELLEREQDPPSRRAGDAGVPGDVGEREGGALAREDLNDGHGTLQRLQSLPSLDRIRHGRYCSSSCVQMCAMRT